MTYKSKNFDNLLGTEGFSDHLLTNHFTLYQGYVANTNKLIETLSEFLKTERTATPEFAELKRRFGWEFNGMRLHEDYFENINKNSKEPNKNSKFFKKIIEDFGSYENWQKDFKSVSLMRGIGWVVLYYDYSIGKMFNVWINEHEIGHLSGAIPLLVMDVFEHAYITDYGLKRIDYIESFFKAINWEIVSKRFEKAPRRSMASYFLKRSR